jgi:hypothetical protein
VPAKGKLRGHFPETTEQLNVSPEIYSVEQEDDCKWLIEREVKEAAMTYFKTTSAFVLGT